MNQIVLGPVFILVDLSILNSVLKFSSNAISKHKNTRLYKILSPLPPWGWERNTIPKRRGRKGRGRKGIKGKEKEKKKGKGKGTKNERKKGLGNRGFIGKEIGREEGKSEE